MQITVSRSELVDALASVVKVVGKKQAPVLAYARITSPNGVVGERHVTLAATDLDVAVSATFTADATAGTMLIPASKMFDLLRASSSETIQISSDKDLMVTAGDFRVKLQTVPVEDFPDTNAMLATGDQTPLSLPQSTLKACFDRTRFATSSEDQRFFMGGIRIEQTANILHVVATDGRRLSLVKTPVDGPDFATLIPRKAVDMLRDVMSDDGDSQAIEIFQTTNGQVFRLGDYVVFSRLPEGQFPAWQRIIKDPLDTPVTVDRKLLIDALKRAAIIGEHSHVIFTVTADGMSLQATSANVGEAEERIPIVSYAGEPFVVTLNASYVADFLNAAGTDQVTLEHHTGGATAVTIWRPVGGDMDYIYVVVPIVHGRG